MYVYTYTRQAIQDEVMDREIRKILNAQLRAFEDGEYIGSPESLFSIFKNRIAFTAQGASQVDAVQAMFNKEHARKDVIGTDFYSKEEVK